MSTFAKNIEKLGIWFLVFLFMVSAVLVLNNEVSASVSKKCGSYGGKLTIAQSASIETLYPPYSTDNVAGFAINQIAENLVTLDSKGNLLPLLAESWEGSQNATIWTFKLRKGVKFHDGTPWDAKAAKANFDRMISDPKTRATRLTGIRNIKSVEAADDHTLVIKMKAPSVTLPADTLNYSIAMISPKTFVGKESPVTKIIGTGPFQFVEWRRGERLVMRANEDYWGGRPCIDQVVIRPIPEASTRVIMLENGEVDLIYFPPPNELERIRNTPGLKLHVGPYNRTAWLMMNTRNGPCKDVRVRQAINLAIDRKALIDVVLRGLGSPIDSIVPSVMAGHITSWKFLEYNPKRARELLAKAGYSKGLDSIFYAPNGRYFMDYQLAQAIQAFLRDIGINAELRTSEWATWFSQQKKWAADPSSSKQDMAFMSWGPANNDTFFHIMSSHTTNQYGNFSYYSSPKVDSLIDIASRTAEREKHLTLLKDAQKQIAEDVPVAPLFFYNQAFGLRNRVQGLTTRPVEIFLLKDVWLKK